MLDVPLADDLKDGREIGADTPEWEAQCAEYFGKIFDEPLRHFGADSYSDLHTPEVLKEINEYAAIGDTNEAYFDDRETFNIFETDPADTDILDTDMLGD